MRRCMTSTISVARRNGTESAKAESSGYVQTSIGIVSGPLIAGRCLLTLNSPAPITIVYTGMGRDATQLIGVTALPFETTRHELGASTLKLTSALSAGSSTVGIQ